MLQRILVPLDGSIVAEQALPLAVRLAQATHSSIQLVHIVTVLNDYRAYASNCPELWKKVVENARTTSLAYLTRIAAREDLRSCDVHLHICTGQPASSILEVAQSSSADLIIMNSHGHTGLKRWALGSVAQQVARYATVPVLILRNTADGEEQCLGNENNTAQVLVALDGSSQAEAVLMPAMQLATALSASGQGIVHLVRVIKPFSINEKQAYGQYDIDSDLREQVRYDAECYLQAIKERLCKACTAPRDIKIIWSVVENKDVAEELIERAERSDTSPTGKVCTLIAMATNGQSELSHWATGNITERVLQHSRLPLFIVRPSASEGNHQIFVWGNRANLSHSAATDCW